MATSCRGWCWQLGLASWLAMGGAIATSFNYAKAQITPDGTLGNENSIVTPTNIDGRPTERIDGGATRGANLFHSFEQFSVTTGSAAYFNNALDIQNIISRVTGSSISNIDGLIRANGTANLFLLNPNGIIFGPSASLNIGGSFLGSTASAVSFDDGTQFSATAHPTTQLLTVSVPLGLQFGGNAGSIRNQSRATNSRGEVVGLQVKPGKTLSLVGGGVRLKGGQLQAPGGRVELGGLASPGSVGLSMNGSFVRLSFPDDVVLADVYLTNSAKVNVAASNGGSIAITARNINIVGGSELRGGLEKGKGFTGAEAGDIELSAIEAIAINNSFIRNKVESGAVGNSGNINIKTGSLDMRNGALLNARTRRKGDAGSVTIHARDTVSFDGVGSNRNSSAVYSTVESPTGMGNGGGINITTGSLAVTKGAFLSASTLGQGNAGSVTIHARDTVSFDGVGSNRRPSAAYSTVNPGAVGKEGSINITTGSLSVTNGAQLNTNTLGQGNAGSVNINARDTVSFDGVGSNRRPSAASSTVESEKAKGNGGNVNITTGSLSLTNGARLSTNSAGSGPAGNIEVAADSIRLENLALLSSETTGDQGNINLNSQDLVLRHGSNITTNATGKSAGGNINIDADVIVALENSDITANAQDARGGRVTINAQGIFGTEFREAKTSESDITATSDLGREFSGTVELNTLNVDPQGLATLPAELVEASGLIATGCSALGESKFIVTGRGGLPDNPSDTLSSDAVQVDLVTLNPREENRSSLISTNPTAPAPAPLVEAQGWVINDKGEVVLTAHAPTVTPHIPWLNPATCHAPENSS